MAQFFKFSFYMQKIKEPYHLILIILIFPYDNQHQFKQNYSINIYLNLTYLKFFFKLLNFIHLDHYKALQSKFFFHIIYLIHIMNEFQLSFLFYLQNRIFINIHILLTRQKLPLNLKNENLHDTLILQLFFIMVIIHFIILYPINQPLLLLVFKLYLYLIK